MTGHAGATPCLLLERGRQRPCRIFLNPNHIPVPTRVTQIGTSVTIANVPPTVAPPSITGSLEPSTQTFDLRVSGTYSDPGAAYSALTVTYSRNGAAAASFPSIAPPATSCTTSTCAYNTGAQPFACPGSVLVVTTVTDTKGATGSNSATQTIALSDLGNPTFAAGGDAPAVAPSPAPSEGTTNATLTFKPLHPCTEASVVLKCTVSGCVRCARRTALEGAGFGRCMLGGRRSHAPTCGWQ